MKTKKKRIVEENKKAVMKEIKDRRGLLYVSQVLEVYRSYILFLFTIWGMLILFIPCTEFIARFMSWYKGLVNKNV